jgi:myo-inositol-1(or 4)-monophosphatase
MADKELEARFEVACAVAEEAGARIRELFAGRKPGTFSLKGHQDYLTEADGEIERLIAGRLAASFPADTFFGEEQGGTFGARTWVVDPIDGTANFARGVPRFCVSIAMVESGRPAIGIVYDPMMRELFATRRRRGATLGRQPLRVSGTDDIRRATVELGWSPRRPMADYAAMLARVVATGAGITRAGSGALALAYVAAGRIDGYAEQHINAWDALAGILLIEEAGGWTSDFLAADGLHQGNALLACTPALATALAEAVGFGS